MHQASNHHLTTHSVYNHRFVNKRGRDLKSASLASYKNRFKNGIDMFLDYANDPSAWKPRMKSRIRGQEKKEPQRTVSDDTINTPQSPPAMQEQPKSLPAAPLIEYPFPLREGQLAYLKLPTNLIVEESAWLTQKLMGILFGVSLKTINEHLINLFDQKEISKEATIRNFRIVQ